MSIWKSWTVLCVVTVCAFFAAANLVDATTRVETWYLPDAGIRLGLDLQGGTQFDIRLHHDEGATAERRADALQQALRVLRSRITDPILGISESTVTAAGDDRIVLRVPGGSSEDRAKIVRIIEPIGVLEFKVVLDESTSREALLHTYGGVLPVGTEIVTQRVR